MTKQNVARNLEEVKGIFTENSEALRKMVQVEFTKLKFKLDLAQKYVSKIISFEIPHFLSPDSLYPSAHTLYRRYHDYLAKR